MRQCPHCDEAALTPRATNGVEVDFCDLCRGLFLDPSEFDALIAQRLTGKKLESLFELIAEPSETALPCPACDHQMLVVDFEGLELDRCASCGGIWIDGHERAAIADRAREGESARPASEDMVSCSGCSAEELQRLCIMRMDRWWCEACVVAGNHPGPEAQAAGIKRRQVEALTAFAEANARQAEKREALTDRKKRMTSKRRQYRKVLGDQALTLDLLEIFSRKLVNWFTR